MDEPATENDEPQHRGGFDRRKFLTRAAIAGTVAYTAPVVTTIGLSRATATPLPCGGATLAATSTQAGPDAMAQRAARGDVTHTPCYQRCLERRATQQHDADVAFYACTQQAGADSDRLNHCTEEYHSKLGELFKTFRTCTQKCK